MEWLVIGGILGLLLLRSSYQRHKLASTNAMNSAVATPQSSAIQPNVYTRPALVTGEPGNLSPTVPQVMIAPGISVPANSDYGSISPTSTSAITVIN